MPTRAPERSTDSRPCRPPLNLTPRVRGSAACVGRLLNVEASPYYIFSLGACGLVLAVLTLLALAKIVVVHLLSRIPERWLKRETVAVELACSCAFAHHPLSWYHRRTHVSPSLTSLGYAHMLVKA